jgi:hypothetical protein
MTSDRHMHIGWAARRAGIFGAVLTAAAIVGGCSASGGNLQGTASSYLIIASLQGSSGAKPGELSNVLASDVQTLVKVTDASGGQSLQPTVFEDGGTVSFTLAMKDPGTSTQPTKPTSTNFITVTRYHVDYIRSDGHNVQGVDVPYSFDGAATVTVTDTGGSTTLTLVRVQAKEEAPLRALINGGGLGTISTIARVTFYGADQAGRIVTVTGQIGVNFSDWGDPQ